jgi:hypothetical protein
MALMMESFRSLIERLLIHTINIYHLYFAYKIRIHGQISCCGISTRVNCFETKPHARSCPGMLQYTVYHLQGAST